MQFKEGSIFLAPMEGVTDDIYRNCVEKTFGFWDYYACDFLRLPAAGFYSPKHILNHYGEKTYSSPYMKEKTYYQVLASPKSHIEDSLEKISKLDFPWLDINLGCPSKKVCQNEGGSFLLSDLKKLEDLIKRFRKHYQGFLTAKIRVGYLDDKNFFNILSCLEANGIETITIHGRTKEELYKGKANWKYIKEAVKHCSIPIIGNGDIWNCDDIQNIFHETNCHGVMVARGALKAPWLAKEYRNKEKKNLQQNIDLFIKNYTSDLMASHAHEINILKSLKNLSRYMFDDLENGEKLKSFLLRSSTLDDYLKTWNSYK